MKSYFCFSVLIFLGVGLNLAEAAADEFQSKITAIPQPFTKTMEKFTWRPGCPVPLHDLAYVTVSYWGFDHKTYTGVLIINKQIAKETVDIFHDLYNEKFPFERMDPVEVYKGSDEASMAANNTSAFNCRPDATFPNKFSVHSYGCAIDINPVINPYVQVKTGAVLPPAGKAYLNRNKPVPGMIVQGDRAYQIFKNHGWLWAGERGVLAHDYQHFEKDCH